MEKLKIQPKREGLEYEQVGSRGQVLEGVHEGALLGDSYEDATKALDDVDALLDFRKKLRHTPFGSFYKLVEDITNIKKMHISKEDRRERIERLVEITESSASKFSPRVADLYIGILSKIKGKPYELKYKEASELLGGLSKKGIDGQISDLDILFSRNQSWDIKLNRIETRLIDNLKGLRAFDRRDGEDMDDDIRKWRKEELKKAPTRPPNRRNESKPGVDPMERLKDGERAPTIWSIKPAYRAFFKEQSFSRWDNERSTWVEDEYIYSDVKMVPLCKEEDSKKGVVNLTINAKITSGMWVSLPIPYSHSLHKIETNGIDYFAKEDQNGDIVILVNGDSEDVEVNVVLSPDTNKKFTAKSNSPEIPYMQSELSDETNQELEKVKNEKYGNIARAHALELYVRKHVQYLAPKSRADADNYNYRYNNHPNGFVGAVDEIKQADCDVANTYFAGLCTKLNIPVRHCVGHSVNDKDKNGASNIHSGTGHGWSEVWDEVKKEWIRVDATPPGDRQLEDQSEQENSGPLPGDYLGQEVIGYSVEELEELRRKLAEHKEKLSYTKEERQLAEGAGVELKEARQIVKEINEAERTRLPNGELVIDALSRLFNTIVESRRVMNLDYIGPVREREGGEEIEDIVGHYIQAMSGEMDPSSRKLSTDETKEEKIIGGFDLYIIGDKSGSMTNTVGGESLWKMQRRAEYLIFSSLYDFDRKLARAGLQKENSLSVRTQGISFRGSGSEDIDLDKPLSSDFSVKDKVKLWHSLSSATGENGDVEALSFVYEQIKEEIELQEKSGEKNNRLRIIITCSDGGYVGSESQMQTLSRELHEIDVIVVGIGLTETATSVPVVMNNPPYSRGDIVRDINDLPALVAKYLVLEAVKLFPEKAKENAEYTIKSIINKFNSV